MPNRSEVFGYDTSGRSRFYREYKKPSYLNLNPVSPIRLGSVQDLTLTAAHAYTHGFLTVYSEFTESEEPERYRLQEYIRTTVSGSDVPAYLFDHHNHAFFAWMEAYREGKIKPGATLIHIDQHSDSKRFPQVIDRELATMEDIAQITQDYITIVEFVDAAKKNGLIKDFIWVHPYEKGMEFAGSNDHTGFKKTSLWSKDLKAIIDQTGPESLIVDLDADFFESYGIFGQMVNEERRPLRPKVMPRFLRDVSLIRRMMRKAGVVTFATSPNFIDQNEAVVIARQLFD